MVYSSPLTDAGLAVGAGLPSSDSPRQPALRGQGQSHRLLGGLRCLGEHLVRPSFHRTPASPPPGSFPGGRPQGSHPLSPPSSHSRGFTVCSHSHVMGGDPKGQRVNQPCRAPRSLVSGVILVLCDRTVFSSYQAICSHTDDCCQEH